MMIPNLKRLANLKTLKINNNEVYSLKDAQQYLPDSLITFEIAGNKIIDLSEICYLKFFSRLVHFSFKNNPCLMKPYNTFNYRIFAVAKILSLLTVDDEEISDSERLAGNISYIQKRFMCSTFQLNLFILIRKFHRSILTLESKYRLHRCYY